jgi:hypothetical protein
MDLTDHRAIEIRSFIKKVNGTLTNEMKIEQFCIGMDYIQEISKKSFLN